MSNDAVGRAVQSRIYRAGVFGRRPVVPVEPAALEAAARARMSDVAWAYVAGGAGQQRTAQANLDAFDRHRIVPRMLVDVEQRDTSVELFGRRLPAPLLFAPIGVLELAHREADHAVAEAARALGLPMVISSQALASRWRSRAAALGDAPRWFQLYWSKDDDVVDSFVARAEAIGSEAHRRHPRHARARLAHPRPRPRLPAVRPRPRASRSTRATRRSAGWSRRAPPPPSAASRRRARPRPRCAPCSRWPATTPADLRDNLRSPLPRAAVETFLDVFSRSSLTWDDLARAARAHVAADRAQGHPAPRRRARSRSTTASTASSCPTTAGARSTGRSARSTRCPAVVEEVDGRVPVLFDSGVRSGADVVKALALGARAVLVGRPWVYGLALAGADGARAVMEHLWAELDLTMALSGVGTVDEIGRDLLALPAGPRWPALFLTVGLPGTGKTTEARRIEAERGALRLTKDEWMKALYGLANPSAASDVIEGRLIDIALRVSSSGIDVVLDFGLWGRDERSALRHAAAARGAAVEMRYFELTPAEQRRRLDQRHAEEPHTTWHMSDEELATWAAVISVPTPEELDGSEPLDAPPAGFATWDEWRTHRWPRSVSSARARPASEGDVARRGVGVAFASHRDTSKSMIGWRTGWPRDCRPRGRCPRGSTPAATRRG